MNLIKVNYLYEVLLSLSKEAAHGRALAKKFNTSLTRIQSILSELEAYNVLDYKTEGKNKVYFIKHNLVARSYILNAENYKLVKLLRKYTFLEPLFKDITEQYPSRMILLFGSYAKFIPKEDSDIDMYVDTTNTKIKEAIRQLHPKLSVKIGKFNQNDLLVKEIIKNHIIVQGGESYYGKLFR